MKCTPSEQSPLDDAVLPEGVQRIAKNLVAPVLVPAATSKTLAQPVDEVNADNLQRQSKMLEYRAYLATPVEVRIAAEREQIRRERYLSAHRRPFQRGIIHPSESGQD